MDQIRTGGACYHCDGITEYDTMRWRCLDCGAWWQFDSEAVELLEHGQEGVEDNGQDI